MEVNFCRALETAVGAAALLLVLVSALKAEGAWKFYENNNEHLQYADGDREIFSFGCSKYVGFSTIYPDQSRKGGQAKVQLSNGKTTLNFLGTLDVNDAGTVEIDVVLDDVSDQDAGTKAVDQVEALLAAGLPITVSAGKGSYGLPAPSIKNLRQLLGNAC